MSEDGEDARSARREAIERAIADVEAITDSEGNAPISELYGLIDRWNRDVRYGDADVLRLADRLDMPDEWHAELKKPQPGAMAFLPLILSAVGCWVVLSQVSSASWVVLASAVLLTTQAVRLVWRFGTREGFNEGLYAGYAAAVFQAHGVGPADREEFWRFFHQGNEDRIIAEVHSEIADRHAERPAERRRVPFNPGPRSLKN